MYEYIKYQVLQIKVSNKSRRENKSTLNVPNLTDLGVNPFGDTSE